MVLIFADEPIRDGIYTHSTTIYLVIYIVANFSICDMDFKNNF